MNLPGSAGDRDEPSASNAQLTVRVLRGVIHDLNNRFGAVAGSAELLHSEPNLDDAVRRRLSDIIESAIAGGVLLDSLRTFATAPRATVRSHDIITMLEAIGKLWEFDLKKRRIEYVISATHEELPWNVCKVDLFRIGVCLTGIHIEDQPQAGPLRIEWTVGVEDDGLRLTCRGPAGRMPGETGPDYGGCIADAKRLAAVNGWELERAGDDAFVLRIPPRPE